MYYGEKRIENPIRWGMVGGGRGSQIGYIHRSAALRDFNFELVAGAFDIDPERGKDFGKQLHVDPDRCYPDYKTMFAEEAKRPDGVQAVSIATPNGMHYEVCKAALEAGLHVVCEKPLCFTSEQADELVKLAEEKHRVVGVTYGYSGHQLIQQARQMIKNGDLGEIRVINMSFAFGGYNFKIEDKVPLTALEKEQMFVDILPETIPDDGIVSKKESEHYGRSQGVLVHRKRSRLYPYL